MIISVMCDLKMSDGKRQKSFCLSRLAGNQVKKTPTAEKKIDFEPLKRWFLADF